MANEINKKPLFTVKTCATSANLGPGYDIAGLALDIYNDCQVFEGSGEKHSIKYSGPYSNDIDLKSNIVISAVNYACKKYADRIKPTKKNDIKKSSEESGTAEDAGAEVKDDAADNEPGSGDNPGRVEGQAGEAEEISDLPSSLDIRMTVNIPSGKGLGSSASAVLSGLLIANKAYNMGLNKKELFQTAAELESSPDNAAAALSGSLAIVYRSGGEYLFEKIELSKDYRILIFIPFGTARTEEARKLIPEKIPLKDAVDNMANFSLFLKYLEEGDLKGSSVFCKDHMYQKYRKAMYPASLGLAAELADTYSIPAFISGAGPAVTAILDEDMFSGFKDIRGKITGEYLSFQSMVAGISEEGSYYL